MNLPPTPRNLARSAAMRGLPRYNGLDAAFDAALGMIKADPTWEADFTAATQPPAPAPTPAPAPAPAPAPVRRVALAVNLTDTRAAALDALDGLFTAAQEARRALNAASAALDAARVTSAAADQALAAASDAARAR